VGLWVWILVVAGVALFIWLLVVLIGAPARRRAAQRDKAEKLRREAEEKLASAARREVAAKREAALAEREREAAEQAMERADVFDPDLPEAPSDGAEPDELDQTRLSA
jgi:flagellar biosynthesis/type III secretory pathway M-ring protein FliF/YscJ